MITARQSRRSPGLQAGLTYVEVMVATVILAVALIPAIRALQTSMLGTTIYASSTADQYKALSKMEEVLAQSQNSLLLAASVAGNATTPTSYSDVPATPVRSLVYLSLYDADDEDGDNDPFTFPDPDLDGDGNPFTDYRGVIWVRVEVEGSVTSVESLSAS